LRRASAIGIPSVCGLAGFILLTAHPGSATTIVGVILMCAALVAASVAIVRLVFRSGPDREREMHAREVFEQTGRWPGE
jgi:hypothetical protein